MSVTASAMRTRVQSIDILRGIVMVIMALDHVRDYFHKSGAVGAAVATNPTDLATTTPFLFFTRWITHFCAPTFVFLAGASALMMGRKKTKKELSLFLIKRGIWLVIVEVLIVTLAWSFNPNYNFLFLQVIWVIGIGMIILGLLVYLPVGVVFSLGLLIVLAHNMLDFPTINHNIKDGYWADMLYFTHFDVYSYAQNHFVLLVYAVIPWTGILLLGYGFGVLYLSGFDAARRRKVLIILGVAATLFFIILRFVNIYGDPVPWSVQPRGTVYTILSFFNLNKYPPSLLFICMTLGPSILLLAFLENVENGFTRVMNNFGRVPMMYYVAHLYLLRIIGVVLFFISGYTSKDIIEPHALFWFKPDGFGYSLLGVYLIWIVVVVLLYPLCKKYNKYKSTHHQWWLSYV